MAKRQIDFTGPSIHDLDIDLGEKQKELNNGISENGNAKPGNRKSGNAKNGTTKIKENKNNATKDGNTNIGIAENQPSKRTYNTVQFTMIRNYLYKALGSADRAEIKLSVMSDELGINPKTLYKHLKTLRETEFIITKLQYGTEIKRRIPGANSIENIELMLSCIRK